MDLMSPYILGAATAVENNAHLNDRARSARFFCAGNLTSRTLPKKEPDTVCDSSSHLLTATEQCDCSRRLDKPAVLDSFYTEGRVIFAEGGSCNMPPSTRQRVIFEQQVTLINV